MAVNLDACIQCNLCVRACREVQVNDVIGMCEQIAHFFQHYKDLEKGKWVTIVKWLDVKGAEKLVLEAIARAEKAQAGGRLRRSAAPARVRDTARRPKARRKE